MSTMHGRDKAQGFTLIEVMVVIVIIAVLAALIVPKVMSLKEAIVAWLDHRKASGSMSWPEFRQATGRAMRRGDVDADAFVTQAARSSEAAVTTPCTKLMRSFAGAAVFFAGAGLAGAGVTTGAPPNMDGLHSCTCQLLYSMRPDSENTAQRIVFLKSICIHLN